MSAPPSSSSSSLVLSSREVQLLLAGLGIGVVGGLVISSLRSRRKQGDEVVAIPRAPRKKIRMWMDGCFDLMHFGHANALRQARALGDELVVGVCSTETIVVCKGPPIMSDDERITMAAQCKWTDEVMERTPYTLSQEYVQELFEKHRIDFIVHGDDPCLTPDGKDVYEHVKKAGRFKMIKRTEGISTTDIVGRTLLLTKSHHVPEETPHCENTKRRMSDMALDADGNLTTAVSVLQQNSKLNNFMPTSRRIAQFSSGVKAPKPTDRVVYVCGVWDLFHVGHVKFLEAARKLGDYLIVGILSDNVVNARYGANTPIMNVHERTLSVLACRFVDEVIIGAAWKITQDMLTSFNINVVVSGSKAGTSYQHLDEHPDDSDSFEIPRQLGMFQFIESPSDMTCGEVVRRLRSQQDVYEAKFARKKNAESKYLSEKVYVQEV